MPRTKNDIPNRLYHKPSNQDRVIWDGKTYYLGIHDTPESLANYAKILASIASTGFAVPPEPESVSVEELAKRYLVSTKKEFPPESKEPKAIAIAINEFVRTHGNVKASKFTASMLIEFRDNLAQNGKSVRTINMKHNYILNMFRWASVHQFIAANVWHLLQSVKKIKPGRTSAKQPRKVSSVEWSHVEAIKHLVPERTWDIICLQWHTGMRSGEVLGMTPREIKNGVYRPSKHKNAWRGHVREIYLGPQARKIVEKYAAGLKPNEKLFGTLRNDSYGGSIAKACRRAGIPHWHPHQLRHAAATRIRERFGLDGSQVVLGHACAKTTEIYAEKSSELAKKIIEEIG